MGVPARIGGDNLPSPVGIGLTDLTNIGRGPVAPLTPPVPASLPLRGYVFYGLSLTLDHTMIWKNSNF